MSDVLIEGHVQDRFGAVREVFKANLESGADVGASVAVTVGGEMAVDLWGGWADGEHARPWTRDTIVNVYSTTKTMAALVALWLADRGELDFDAPVARYWPEFAANGKEGVTVAHLMSHAAGLPTWDELMAAEDLYDWPKATAMLAAQKPRWEPGSAPGYHALTQGYLVGEVVRRITGRTIGTVFREEFADPLGADFHIGLDEAHDERVAHLIPPPVDPNAPRLQANPPIRIEGTRTRAWRGAEIPAAGGTGNARSVAQVHAILANGGVANGRRFLSEAGCRRALELQVEGEDKVLRMPARFGMGFGLSGGALPLANDETMYWGGYGGSLAIIDMKNRVSFAFVMNKMAGTTVGDTRAFKLAMAVWGAIGAG